jgi:ubiquinone/menaquinone biosynthesis C-methylase UbiE
VGERPLPLAFGSVAETYDRVRPPYFRPLLDRAQEVLELGSRACVLDLGAGSGRLTRELAARFDSVIAVEPDDEMRGLVDVGTVLCGSAEKIPLTDASVDAVFVGEAFHWFDAPRAISEIARVLRPRGALSVISTHWWETDPPLPESVLELLREPYERTAQQRRPRWDEAFEASPFEPLRYEHFEEAITVNADRLLALYSTTSALAALSHSERGVLIANVRPRLTGPYRLPIDHELCWTQLA